MNHAIAFGKKNNSQLNMNCIKRISYEKQNAIRKKMRYDIKKEREKKVKTVCPRLILRTPPKKERLYFFATHRFLLQFYMIHGGL